MFYKNHQEKVGIQEGYTIFFFISQYEKQYSTEANDLVSAMTF